MIQLACSTYSLNQLIQSGEATQLETIEIAKNMGFDAIEIVDLILPKGTTDEVAYVKQLKAELDRLAFPITSFTFASDLINGSDGQAEVEIARIKKMIDYAEILGAPRVRHDATWGVAGKSFDQVLPQLADGFRTIAAYAEPKGIVVTTENHGLFAQDSERMERLYTAVNHPNFKLLVDMGNFLCVDEDPTMAVSRLAPFANYVHVKDFHVKSGSETHPGEGFFQSRGGNHLRGAISGHGNVPVEQCLRIMKQAGYQGPFAIEFEGIEDNLKGLTICLANVRRMLATVYQ